MSIAVFEHIKQVNDWVARQRNRQLTVGFVPTMGALHAGHQSLIALARQNCDVVIASIFVNPTQFNNAGDLAKYPRTLKLDIEKLSESGCDAVFCPAVEEMYPNHEKGHWNYGPLSNSLEGHFRPGHFDGVLTIVKKLFIAVQPDKAFFGEKDFQQLALIKRMTADEGLPIEIVTAPTIREPSGLAMSSRNMRLNAEQLATAAIISKVLFDAAKNARSHDPKTLLNAAKLAFECIPDMALEYFEIVVASTFEEVTEWPNEPCVFLVACYLGDVRLIDNVIVP